MFFNHGFSRLNGFFDYEFDELNELFAFLAKAHPDGSPRAAKAFQIRLICVIGYAELVVENKYSDESAESA